MTLINKFFIMAWTISNAMWHENSVIDAGLRYETGRWKLELIEWVLNWGQPSITSKHVSLESWVHLTWSMKCKIKSKPHSMPYHALLILVAISCWDERKNTHTKSQNSRHCIINNCAFENVTLLLKWWKCSFYLQCCVFCGSVAWETFHKPLKGWHIHLSNCQITKAVLKLGFSPVSFLIFKTGIRKIWLIFCRLWVEHKFLIFFDIGFIDGYW